MVKNTWKTITAVGVAALLVGGFASPAIWNDDAQIDQLTADLAAANAVEPIVVTEVVEVEVDNGNLDLVLQHIFDNDGEVEHLTDDLDDDEVSEIVDRVVFVNEVKDLAVKEVRAELFEEVEDFTDSEGELNLDEDDLRTLRIDDNQDELNFQLIDWDDGEAEVTVTGTFKDNSGTKYSFEAQVTFEDGEVDDLNVINVTDLSE